jgi:hypothetical protein
MASILSSTISVCPDGLGLDGAVATHSSPIRTELGILRRFTEVIQHPSQWNFTRSVPRISSTSEADPKL